MAKPSTTKAPRTGKSSDLLILTNCTRSPYTRPLQPGEIKVPGHTILPGGSCTISREWHEKLMKVSRPYSALVGQQKLRIKENAEDVVAPEQLQNTSEPQMPADLKENPITETANGPKEAVSVTKDVTIVDAPTGGDGTTTPPTSVKRGRA